MRCQTCGYQTAKHLTTCPRCHTPFFSEEKKEPSKKYKKYLLTLLFLATAIPGMLIKNNIMMFLFFFIGCGLMANAILTLVNMEKSKEPPKIVFNQLSIGMICFIVSYLCAPHGSFFHG